MTQRPARTGTANRSSRQQSAAVIWVPAGEESPTSSGVEVRVLQDPRRGIDASPATEPSRRLATEGRRQGRAQEQYWSEKSRTRRSSAPPARSTRTGSAPVTSTEQLPVSQAPSKWEIPDSWDRPEGTVGPLGPDGEVPLPDVVEAAAREVMALYDMRVSGMRLITSKPDKGGAIWRIETNRGPRSLKLLHREAHRSLFSIGAQEYLVKKGARVPPLCRTRSGDICVQTGNKLWIVTDWIEPLVPATKVDLAGAAALCNGLGEFQRISKGYVPPKGARYSTRLHRWPQAYRKILAKIGWFREIARAYAEFPAAQTLLGLVDRFEQQARDAIARLEASAYAKLAARGEQAWGIVHQG
ncbi:MAG TPA: hypothetical protein VNT01_15900 [Symbiobacteriaceae bacterium]|nr:hypothetical protein [Symbiobacteriaceae bacterium]